MVLTLSAALLYMFRQFVSVTEQVEVDSGAASVLLPCRTTRNLPGDVRVVWRDSNYRKVYVFEDVSDRPEEQDQFYKDRTCMKFNLLRTGDLSLTLRLPTAGDSNIYTCIICNRKGDILMKKQVWLWVKVPQVEVESGVESVLLPCRTTFQLPGDATVEWRGRDNMKVHVYRNGSNYPEKQSQFYRDRTSMDENLLEKGDFSLTLRYPTDGDNHIYTCIIYIIDKDNAVCKVEVEQGKESVLLPFTTTPVHFGGAGVVWRDHEKTKVHVNKNGLDQPGEQNVLFKGRTKMNEALMKSGDLSLTLRRPTYRDSGPYRCEVWREGQLLRGKTVCLKVKARTIKVQDQKRTSEPEVAPGNGVL